MGGCSFRAGNVTIVADGLRNRVYSAAMKEIVEPGLRHGVYSYREAARLLGVASQRVARWADGYVFQLKYGQGRSKPILQTERNQGVLSFEELWELLFVKEYVSLNVSLQHIRATAEALAKEVGSFPFSTTELLVDSRHLFIKEAEGILRRPDIGQMVSDYAESMVPRIEWAQDGRVGRYYPPEFDRVVYLDKERRGGEPLVSDRAIPTRIVYSLWEKEHEIDAVADYYEISPEQVKAAIQYEGKWRLAA